MDSMSQWTLRFLNYEPVDEALDDRMRRIAEDADKIPDAAMTLDRETGVLTIDCAKVPAWCDSAQRRLRSMRIGRSFVVKPPWVQESIAPHERLLEIDPAGAFGSALHETTQLCLLAIERSALAGSRVLEIGAGSGVLSIAAARCGAARVRAVDIDLVAVRSARANVLRNGLNGVVEVLEANGPPWIEGQVDAIIANITYDVLTRLWVDVALALRPGGLLIASGISARNWEAFVLASSAHGFDEKDQLHRGPWSALIAKRRMQ